MRRLTFTFPAVAMLLVSVAVADSPTLPDLLQLFKQGDYDGVVKGCTDALAPGGVTEPADRYKVASLKGEAQLRLKQADGAIDAFASAAKETDDPRLASVATATAILIGRSKDFVYTSQTTKAPSAKVSPSKPLASLSIDAGTSTPGTATPAVLVSGQFDIIDPQHRKAAIDALWTDERKDAEKTVKEKIALKSLPMINDALDRIHQAEPIAIAAGETDWAQTQKDALANAARLDANSAMKDMNTQLISITKNQAKRRNKTHPQPMPQGDRDQVNQITQGLDKITTALKALPDALHVDKDTYQSQLDQADRLEDRATTVLATD